MSSPSFYLLSEHRKVQLLGLFHSEGPACCGNLACLLIDPAPGLQALGLLALGNTVPGGGG